MPATYQLDTQISIRQWSYDGLSFFHQSQIGIKFEKSPVPEPGASAVLGTLAIGLVARRRRV